MKILIIIDFIASMLLAVICYQWGYSNGRGDEHSKRLECDHDWNEYHIGKGNGSATAVLCAECGDVGFMMLNDDSLIVHPDMTKPIDKFKTHE